MKAIIFTQYGSPDGLELREVPKPEPKKGELLVRVHASSINSWDWEYLNGVPFVNRLMFGLLKPRRGKRILGADIAGTVEAVGRQVERFQPGDAVFGDLWSNWGGFAEYACIDQAGVVLKPLNTTFEEVAVVPQAGVLALQGIRKAGQLRPGQTVLINGAGGGVGTFAIQLAKLYGAEVTGVDASHKLDIMRSAGADHIIDYMRENFTKIGKRYDLIIDCQNIRPLSDNINALEPGGVFAMVGGSRVVQVLLMGFYASLTRETRKFSLVAAGPNAGLGDLKELIEAGKIIPIIDRTYTLREVPEALRYFGSGRHTGKIAITMET